MNTATKKFYDADAKEFTVPLAAASLQPKEGGMVDIIKTTLDNWANERGYGTISNKYFKEVSELIVSTLQPVKKEDDPIVIRGQFHKRENETLEEAAARFKVKEEDTAAGEDKLWEEVLPKMLQWCANYVEVDGHEQTISEHVISELKNKFTITRKK